jgi:hypothetical protein
MYSLKRTTALAATMIAALVVTVPARTPVQASQTKEPTCSISGRVTIAGLPARGITVLLLSGEDGPIDRPVAKATTDRDGHFQMTGVPAGQHLLQAFAPALIVAPTDNMMGRSGKVINITAGEALEGMDIALTRGAAITGRVSDAEGQPLIQENVQLFAVTEQGRKAPAYMPYGSMSTTDDRGVYRLFGVLPGRYIVSVGVDTNAPPARIGFGNTYYPLTYHPDVADEAKATVVEVAAGSEATGVDIVLGRASKAYSVSGRINDAATGKPLIGLQYGYGWMDREGGRSSTGFANSTSGARGEFRLDGVAPGQYSAFAFPSTESEMYSDTATFTVSDSDVAGIEIKVHRGSSISGTVVIEGAASQRGAPRLSDLRLSVSSGSLNVAPVGRLVTVAPDGAFRSAGLPRGIANLRLSMYPAPKGLSLVRVERDGVELKNGIEVGLAEEISGVKVVFGYGTGAIRGQVQIEGGEIPQGAMMFLSLQRAGTNQPQQYRRPPVPDSRGKFAVDGLLPGEYELSLTFQVRPVSGSSQMSPKFVKQKVTVTNGAETQVTMVVDLNEKNQ